MKATALIDVRSIYNVGSVVRSAGFFGLDEVWCVGVTPHPAVADDQRLPHVVASTSRKIHKVALGAEDLLTFKHFATTDDMITYAQQNEVVMIAIEQSQDSVDIKEYTDDARKRPVDNFVLILGEETQGLNKHLLDAAETAIEIHGSGVKESLNIASAAAIAYAYFDY